jgi:phosphatidylglycerol:prolipoprotein diacylglycerol transferase
MYRYTGISFPGLGLEFDPIREFALGPLNIHLYGAIIAFGLILAVWYSIRRSEEFGVDEDLILDGVLWIVPFAIACARAYYVLFTWDSYKDNLISALYIWEGGLAIYGGVLGAAVGVTVYCKIKKLKLAALLDLVAIGFLIGQSLGRWGNFFNREAFGAATESFFRMGLYNIHTEAFEYYHPTFLYESLWNAAGFVLLHFLSKRRKYDGQMSLGYVAWYGLGRTFIEGLRMDSLYWGDFRVSQLLAAVSCFAAVAVLMYMMFRQHDPAALQVNITASRQNPPEEPESVSGMEPLFREEEEKAE